MEGAKIEGITLIRVPYVKSNGYMYNILKRFCDEIEAGADTTDSVYAVWGLRLTELVQEVERLSKQVDGLKALSSLQASWGDGWAE